jgi:uncharacterized protein YegL
MAEDGKMESVNNVAREMIPHMRDVANENPNAEVLMRMLAFSTGAHWHVETPKPIEDFVWQDLSAGGRRDLGAALILLSEALTTEKLTARGLPPVLVLLTDGAPTDDFSMALKALMAQPWGNAAVRIGIALGKNADLTVLRQFIGHTGSEPLSANNPEALVKLIRLVSTTVTDDSRTLAVGSSKSTENFELLIQTDRATPFATKSTPPFEADELPWQTRGLNDLPRRTLRDIIIKYGPTLYEDARRCEAFLRDLCAIHKREISVLMAALNYGVINELISQQSTSPQILVARLSHQLEANLALTPIAARWAVESWAIAIGILSGADQTHERFEEVSSETAIARDVFFRITLPQGKREAVSLILTKGLDQEPPEPYWYKTEAEKIKKYIVSSRGRPILLTGHGHFGESYLTKWAINESARELARQTRTRQETVVMKIPVDLVGQDSEGLWLNVNRWVINVWENPEHERFKKRYQEKLKILGQNPFFSLRELTTSEREGLNRGGVHLSGPVGGGELSREGKGKELKKVYVPLTPQAQLETLLQSLAVSLPSQPASELMRFLKSLWNDGIPYRIVLLLDRVDNWHQLKALERLVNIGGALKIVAITERSHYDTWKQNEQQATWTDRFFNVIKCFPVLDGSVSEDLSRFFFAIENRDLAKPIIQDFINGLNFHCFGSPASLPKELIENWDLKIDEAGRELLIVSDESRLMPQYRIWAIANRVLCKQWREIIGNHVPLEPPDHPTLGEYEIRARLFLYQILKEIIRIGNAGFSERELLDFCQQSERSFNLEMSGKYLADVCKRLTEAVCHVGLLQRVPNL